MNCAPPVTRVKVSAEKSRHPRFPVTDLLTDAEGRYKAAIRRRNRLEREWRAQGRPLLQSGSRGQVQEHSLLRAIRDHDVLCDRLALALRKSHAGPEPSAVVRPYRKITRLEAVPAPKPKPRAGKKRAV